METLAIDCWVHGTDVGRIIPIEISRSSTVGALKDAIKKKKPVDFRDIDAKNLDLYKVSGSLPEDEQHLEAELKKLTLHDMQRLSGHVKLSKVFPESDLSDDEAPFIIIKAPTVHLPATQTHVVVPDLDINCWVRGYETNRIFAVKISRSKTVGALKDAIKNEKPVGFRDIDANTLVLYKVSLASDEGLEETLKGLTFDHEKPLHPLHTLSEVFPDAPLKRHIHIVIEAPLSVQSHVRPLSSYPALVLHQVEAQRLTFLRADASTAPSSGGQLEEFSKRQNDPKQAIYCNRPHSARATIPVTLLHPVFGQFLDDCETRETTAEDNAFAMEFSIAMSNFYLDEQERAQEIRNVFSAWDLDFTCSNVGDAEYMTGGDISVNDYRYAIAEFKNEVCSTGAEPYAQA
ncbi:hypothetical protein HYDPIDRAFT_29189, partial [Hydnomerulius pinastri MD-312]